MRIAAGGAFAVVLALAAVTVAFAHAEPARVKPGDGAVVTTAPPQVEIEMSQDMARQEGANDIDVFDSTGKEVTVVAAVIDNGDRRKLTVPLPAGLAPGLYTVKWKTLSADDGDAADGQLTFTYDPNGTANPGKEVLKDDVLGTPAPGATGSPVGAPAVAVDDSGGGTSWVLVTAVAIGMFVVGGGATFLLVQKKP